MPGRRAVIPASRRALIDRLKVELEARYDGLYHSIKFERVRFDFSVSYRARNRHHDQVLIRVTPSQYGSAGTIEETPFSVPYSSVDVLEVANDEFIARVRPYAKTTLADELRHHEEFDDEGAAILPHAEIATARLGQVRDLFTGLAAIHGAGIIHGDVRPANVSVEKMIVRWMDYDTALPPRYLFDHERRYLAPEAFDGWHTTAGDTFALGQIASRMLSARSMQFADPLHLRIENLHVIPLLDATTSPNPASRPSAQDVAFLLGADVPPRAETRKWATWLDTIGGHAAQPRQKVNARRWLKSYIAHAPTRAAEQASVFDGAYDFSTVTGGEIHVYQIKEYHHSGERKAPERYSINDELPDVIDGAWEAQIAEQLIPLQAEMDDAAEDLVLRALERNAHVANEVRLDILRENRFISEGRVAEELLRRNLIRSREEVSALRNAGRLVYVRDHGRWIYPAFQFETKSVHLDLIEALQRKYQREANRWGVISWWVSPNILLDGQLPRDVLASDPDRLRVIAELEHNGPLSG